MFNRILYSIQDYFGYSRQEARGFVAILGLMLVLWVGPLAYRKLAPIKPESKADTQKLDSLVAVLNTVQIEENAKRTFKNYANYKDNATTYNSPEQPRVLFDFDPNTATVEQFQSMGFPRFLAERIEKYRSKGGKFRKKEDLQRIYGLQPTLYNKVEPYIQIAATNKPTFGTSPLVTTNATATDNKPVFVKPKITAFDINTADTSDLIKLKGIGSKLALRIVKFRDGLGGFYDTNQYTEIFGLDSLALSELNRYAQVRSAVKKIPLNTASPEDLDRLPYLSFKQSQVIVRFRAQHGSFKTPDDLLKIKILDAKIIEKITPYLSFD
jgi:competence protein ComEA